MENFYYLNNNFGEERWFNKDESDKDKYLVATCAKNENDYIREWIQHYLNLNFDKIIICDNNDDESLLDVISDYIKQGVVEVFDCRGMGSFQVQFYSMFCTEGNYKWCGYFDCDEFLELGLYSDIKEYLSTKEDEICVSFNWMVYGSNGKRFKEDGAIQERFKYPVSPISLFTENCFIKSIVRGGGIFANGCWFNGSHIPMTTPMYRHNIGGYHWKENDSHQVFPPRYKEGYIKHYYTKSFEEWCNKSRRGWPDGTENLNMSKFFVCNDWCNFPIKEMSFGLFTDKSTQDYSELLNDYDVILLGNPNEHIYAFMINVIEMIQQGKGNTFVIKDKHIDDTLYNLLLEIAIRTGNNLVWANDDDDVWRAYLKYNKGKNYTYFVYNFF